MAVNQLVDVSDERIHADLTPTSCFRSAIIRIDFSSSLSLCLGHMHQYRSIEQSGTIKKHDPFSATRNAIMYIDQSTAYFRDGSGSK